ncbi:Rubrerythrin-2 [archaeon SCG-AAA382B04]|nr:Rubrerythrin-2 [archaeon SCG-AAA382B04]
MKEITKTHLKNAFSGESMANIRYKIYSEKAKKQDFPSISLLFEAIAYAEHVHARNHLRRLPEETDSAIAHAPFGVGDTIQNLEKGIEGEEFEINEMYPSYKEVADFQSEKKAAISFKWALEAEGIHKAFFEKAKEKIESGEGYKLEKINICSTCGYTTKGKAPDQCPICGADKKQFRKFET